MVLPINLPKTAQIYRIAFPIIPLCCSSSLCAYYHCRAPYSTAKKTFLSKTQRKSHFQKQFINSCKQGIACFQDILFVSQIQSSCTNSTTFLISERRRTKRSQENVFEQLEYAQVHFMKRFEWKPWKHLQETIAVQLPSSSKPKAHRQREYRLQSRGHLKYHDFWHACTAVISFPQFYLFDFQNSF